MEVRRKGWGWGGGEGGWGRGGGWKGEGGWADDVHFNKVVCYFTGCPMKNVNVFLFYFCFIWVGFLVCCRRKRLEDLLLFSEEMLGPSLISVLSKTQKHKTEFLEGRCVGD